MLAKFPFGGNLRAQAVMRARVGPRELRTAGAGGAQTPQGQSRPPPAIQSNIQPVLLQRCGLRRAPGRSATRPCRDVSAMLACERTLLLHQFSQKGFTKGM
jgi:hypothetical protein